MNIKPIKLQVQCEEGEIVLAMEDTQWLNIKQGDELPALDKHQVSVLINLLQSMFRVMDSYPEEIDD
jgi:hypothetical protein